MKLSLQEEGKLGLWFLFLFIFFEVWSGCLEMELKSLFKEGLKQ